MLSAFDHFNVKRRYIKRNYYYYCNLQGQNTRAKNPSKPLNTVPDIKRTRREVKEVT